MKFFCGACKTKYQISDTKVRGKILTIRCQKCGAKIIVRESAVETATVEPVQKPAADKVEVTVKDKIALVAGRARSTIANFPGDEEEKTSVAADPRNEQEAIEWFTAHNGVQSGPFELKEIVRRIQSRELEPNHYVWHQHMGAWTRLREVQELAGHIPPPATIPSTPPALPSAAPAAAASVEGAEVVDFASKLAERERTKRVESSSIKPRSGRQAPVTDDKWSARTEQVSARVEKREPPTPSPASGPLSSPAAIPVSGESLSPIVLREEHDDFAGKEDIFANIPRIEPEPTRIKESTRFFVAAAGIQERHKRQRVGKMLGIGGAAAVVMFLGSWAFGLVNISFERMKNPFSFGTRAALEEYEDEGSLEDASDVAEKLDPKERKKRRSTRQKGNLQASAEERKKDGRGHEVPSTLKFDSEGNSKFEATLPEVELPSPELNGFQPPVDRPELSEQAVSQVVAAGRRSISICYATALKNEKVRGRLELQVTIKPNGDVARVTKLRSPSGANAVADCIAEKIRDWKFPSFQGSEPTDVRIPFLLEQQF